MISIIIFHYLNILCFKEIHINELERNKMYICTSAKPC